MAAAYDVYATQLYSVGEGLALYEPDPAGRYDRIRNGDVGFVQRGFFHRLFNIFADEEDPINREGVPAHFSPLGTQYRTTVERGPLTGAIHSSSVRKLKGSLQTAA